ncbi:MAG: hypothetical protein JSU00_15835 [Acidobacteria bacterium]|nr:hypothetical protein [Acidobacteriota bacterium]
MTADGTVLASIKGLGAVYDCGGCGNIHLQVGPLTLALEPGAYMQLVALLSTSAANFELLLEQRSKAAHQEEREGK